MTTVSAESLSFEVEGLHIAAQAWGQADGIPVLALHGWLDNAASFAAIAEYLQQQGNPLRIVALDLPGHGYSDHKPPSGNYAIWDDLRIICGVAEQLGWSQYSLLAHSRGAMIAALLASAMPDNIRAVVCIDGLLADPQAGEEFPKQLQRYLNGFSNQGRPPRAFDTLEDAAAARIKVMPMSKCSARAIAERGTYQGDDGKFYWRSDRRLALASPHKLTAEQWRAVLQGIHAPLLFIAAKQGFGQEILALSDARPKAFSTLDVDGDHHCHMDSCVEEVAEAVRGHFPRYS